MKKTLTKQEQEQFLRECLKDCGKCEQLVQRYGALICHTVQKTLHLRQVFFIPEDIENLTNDVYVALFDKGCHKLRQYKEDGGLSLSGWIRMIAVQTVLMRLRKKDIHALSGQNNLSSFEETPDLADEITKIEVREKLRQVRVCMETLSALERLVFKLHISDALPSKAIAALLSRKVNNIDQIMFRARKRLKKCVENAEQGQN